MKAIYLDEETVIALLSCLIIGKDMVSRALEKTDSEEMNKISSGIDPVIKQIIDHYPALSSLILTSFKESYDINL